MAEKKIIITIPAYNEEKTLPRVIKDIKKVMSKTSYKYLLQVVNDGSKDKTAMVAKKNGARVVSHKKNMGLAETFKTEMQECVKLGADVIVHTDADGQYDPKAIPAMIKKVIDGTDLVLGSRFAGKIEHMPFMKKIGNKAFSRVISSLTKTRITDSTTGYRAFTGEVARDIKFVNTFTYTQEQIIRAAKQNFTIAEVPIRARKTRESRLFSHPLQYAWRAWINILRIYRDYNPLKFFGSIGITLAAIGFLIGIWLVYLFLTTGRVGHLPSAILSMLLITTGVQITIFGFMADMHKKL